MENFLPQIHIHNFPLPVLFHNKHISLKTWTSFSSKALFGRSLRTFRSNRQTQSHTHYRTRKVRTFLNLKKYRTRCRQYLRKKTVSVGNSSRNSYKVTVVETQKNNIKSAVLRVLKCDAMLRYQTKSRMVAITRLVRYSRW